MTKCMYLLHAYVIFSPEFSVLFQGHTQSTVRAQVIIFYKLSKQKDFLNS